MNWKTLLFSILAVLTVCVVSCSIWGRKTREKGREQGYTEGFADGYAAPHPADTVIRIDTVTIEKPVPVEREVVRTDTIAVNDTLYVPVPIEAVLFGGQPGDEYKALVSGWHPAIEWIEVYPRTEVVTNYIDRPVPYEKPVPYTWKLSAKADALAMPGLYDARAGLRFDRQLRGPIRWSVEGGYHVGNLGRGPYVQGGLELEILHDR